MGNAPVVREILRALSCETLCTHVLNAMDCESECGFCGCKCHTDEIPVSSDDEELEVSSCCGTVHYTTQ